MEQQSKAAYTLAEYRADILETLEAKRIAAEAEAEILRQAIAAIASIDIETDEE